MFRFFIGLICLLSTVGAEAAVHVRGYFRKNGTYVAPHYRSSPDSSVWNNWSTKGNVNPYTGKAGTKDAVTGFSGGTPAQVVPPVDSTSSQTPNEITSAESNQPANAQGSLSLSEESDPKANSAESDLGVPKSGPIPDVFTAVFKGYSLSPAAAGCSAVRGATAPFFVMGFRNKSYRCYSNCPDLAYLQSQAELEVFNKKDLVSFSSVMGTGVVCSVQRCEIL